jgi:hypothetical protein
MNKQKIIQINGSELNHEKILPFLNNGWPQHNWQHLKDCYKTTDTHNIVTQRIGHNIFPFCTDTIDSCNIKPPDYDGTFTETFNDITDKQCQQWLQEKTDRPWLIYWSGGIDSTVIVASILKNTSPADRENIYIACNRASIYESPRFFYNHVQPNFKLIPTPDPGKQPLHEQYHVIDGEFGDHLYCGGNGWELFQSSPDSMVLNVRHNPDLLLNHFATKTNKNFAVWYYECLLDNVNSTNIPVETYHDFCWWIFFNYHYTSSYIKIKRDTFTNNYSPRWFATDDYQQWAMNNNQLGTKYTLNRSDNKLASKQYIYDFDRDDYCRLFKTKSLSVQVFNQPEIMKFFCTLDDYSTLYLDRDLDRILELLPDYILD